MPTIARSLAAAAATTALVAALAGCQGGDHPTPSPSPVVPTSAGTTGTEQSANPEPEDSAFLGKSASGSRQKVNLPQSRVGEAAGRTLTIVNDKGESTTVQQVSATTDSGDTTIAADNCSGAELPPGGSCTVTIRHVATEAGSYSGELTAETSAGEALTVEITGEAVGGEPTPDDTASIPEDTSPTPEVSETPDTASPAYGPGLRG
ncbi:hypothetical protein [Streptomyces sp. NPDC051109]|uniref:Ig-like domain-containing protein n=1 Tax=Streptomyces sp. NPDC051109 TaxID=3365642 RepID=UPI00379E40C8